MMRLRQTVRLTKPMGRFKQGATGTIGLIHNDGRLEVELHQPAGLATVRADDIEPVTKIRPLGPA